MNLHGIYRCILAVIVTNLGGSNGAMGGGGKEQLQLKFTRTWPRRQLTHSRTHLHMPVFPYKKPQKWDDSAIVRCLHAHMHTYMYIYMYV